MADLAELILVRHGQSTANAAFMTAATQSDLGLTGRDADIGLSPLGEHQAARLGGWLAARPPAYRPEVVVCSTFHRAVETWRIAAETAGAAGAPMPVPVTDARLVDRDTGAFELLHPAEVRRRFPDEAGLQARDGKYHYRPPGGETLLDVADRVGAVLADLRRDHPGRRVLIVAHDAVVLMMRYRIEGLTFTDLDRAGMADNASVTRYDGGGGTLVLAGYNEIAHLGSP